MAKEHVKSWRIGDVTVSRIVEVWDADRVRLCRNTFDDEGRVLTQVSSFGTPASSAASRRGRVIP